MKLTKFEQGLIAGAIVTYIFKKLHEDIYEN